jgi:tRNA(Ile)-lysidine synthase TilS/MesJ
MTVEERLRRRFGRAVGQYRLIEDGDHILMGLSGGKDSLCLLELLARRSRIQRPQFTVEALHVHMENIHYETDTTYLQDFCQRLEVPLHIVTTSFNPSLGSDAWHRQEPSTLNSRQKTKPPCFLCSWQRRKQLFNLAQQIGCNKIALGHHQDDIIHTALMNLTFQGHFSTMPALLRMRKMPLTIIRPLCLCTETDIRTYAEQQGYRKQLKQCPYEHDTNRTAILDIYHHLQQLNPEVRYSIWNALEAAEKLVEY